MTYFCSAFKLLKSLPQETEENPTYFLWIHMYSIFLPLLGANLCLPLRSFLWVCWSQSHVTWQSYLLHVWQNQSYIKNGIIWFFWRCDLSAFKYNIHICQTCNYIIVWSVSLLILKISISILLRILSTATEVRSENSFDFIGFGVPMAVRKDILELIVFLLLVHFNLNFRISKDEPHKTHS